ncbi:Maf family protein [Ampullimonas aquatilis]|uniref:Maf family protein n=1 Tax=Ampullimonas aquatilis TaxID=1341549 RepID=UPI003C7092FD
MSNPDFIYLASQSPRRQELLTQIGVKFELLLPDADENAEALEIILPNEAPAQYVKRVTLLKLAAAQLRLQRRGLPPAAILAADTTVALRTHILGKPADEADLRSMLTTLSGKEHQVLTAVAVGLGEQHELQLSVSNVRFNVLSQRDILRYVESGEGYGKAGGYGIQGKAATFVTHIVGSYSGIMGLPLFETAQALKHLGLDIV